MDSNLLPIYSSNKPCMYLLCEILHRLSGLQNLIIIPESSDMTRHISIVFKVCSEDGSHLHQFILYNFCDLGCHRNLRILFHNNLMCDVRDMFHPRPRSYIHSRPGKHGRALRSCLGGGIHRCPVSRRCPGRTACSMCHMRRRMGAESRGPPASPSALHALAAAIRARMSSLSSRHSQRKSREPHGKQIEEFMVREPPR